MEGLRGHLPLHLQRDEVVETPSIEGSLADESVTLFSRARDLSIFYDDGL